MCKPSRSGHPIDVDLEDALRAIGFTQQEINAGTPSGVIIYRYTRAQAIEDGVLVDLMQPATERIVRDAGFTIHLAMTSTAWAACVGFGELPAGQDAAGRLWDVLMVMKNAIGKLPPGSDRVYFDVSVFDGQKRDLVKLWAVCGPGDEGEPVITIMCQGED